MSEYHQPVMLAACLDALDINPNGTYVDLTMGGFGHSREILARLVKGKLIAFDQDEEAKSNIPKDDRVLFIHSNFRYLCRWLHYYGIEKVDGILADLGVSSHQFDMGSRGFSYRFEGPLDMRMDKRYPLTAADVLNKSDEKKLADIFFRYGDIIASRRLARAIIKQRCRQPFARCEELKMFLDREEFGTDPSYLSRIYQSLRIAVNEEEMALAELLPQCAEVLNTGGKLVILSYHSLEDRMVKNFFRSGDVYGEEDKNLFGLPTISMRAIHKKPLEPAPDEIIKNPRARSAKLRSAIKI